MTQTKAKVSYLKLVHPPFSNQEAVWAKNDPELIAELKRSHFYMIGARAEARFKNLRFDQENHLVTFNFQIGNQKAAAVTLDLRLIPGTAEKLLKMDMSSLPGVSFDDNLSYWFEGGEQIIRFWGDEIGEPDSDLLQWFTTEKLLWDYSRGMPGITGLENYLDFATYDLLYVGIATEQDSYERLIKKGHHKRQEILSNEPQRSSGARVTDEVFLFLYTVDQLIVRQFTSDHNFSNEKWDGNYDRTPIIRDAEKAFVSLLQPAYNEKLFPNYPKGSDGLYKSDYDRYGYLIGENIAFNTPQGLIKGGWDYVSQNFSNDADFIFVQGDNVEFLHPPHVSAVAVPFSKSSISSKHAKNDG